MSGSAPARAPRGLAGTRWVLDHPWLTLGLIGAITLLLAGGATRLRMDVDPWIFLRGDHPLRVQFKAFQDDFDNQEPLLIGIERPEGIFDTATLESVVELTDWLEDLDLSERIDEGRVQRLVHALPEPGPTLADEARAAGGWDAERAERVVEIALEAWGEHDPRSKFLLQLPIFLRPIHLVTSLHSVEDIRGDELGLTVEPLMEEAPVDEAGLAALRERVLGDPLLVGAVINAEATATAIAVEPNFTGNQAEVAIALYDEVRARVAPLEERGLGVYVAGSPAIAANMSSLVFEDLRVLVPLVLAVAVLVLVLSFRNVIGVVVPIAVVVISVIWTLGIMGLAGIPYSFIMSAMPVLLIAIGSADGIHVISEYELHRSHGLGARDAILATMGELNAPVVLTSITSSIGFASLKLNDIVPIGHLGLCVAIGILSAMAFSLTFIPAALIVAGDRGHGKRTLGRPDEANGTQARLRAAGAWLVARRRPVAVGTVVVAVLAVGLATRLQIREDSLRNFDRSTRIRSDGEAINRLFAGAASLYVVVDSGETDGVYEPSVAGAIATFQDEILAVPHVGRSLSYADVVARINRVLHDDDRSWERVPLVEEVLEDVDEDGELQRVTVPGREQIAQFLLLYESGGGERISHALDGRRRSASVSVQAESFDSLVLRELLADVREVAERTLPELDVDYTGFVRLQPAVSLMVVQGQVASLSLSFVVVAILMCVVYRSVVLGMIGMAPLLVTIATNFAIMGTFGWPLNIGTAIVASTALGIGIDYSIHVLSRFQLYRWDRPAAEAARDAFAATARGISINAVSVAAGFLVLTAASFVPVRLMGILVATAMLVSATACLVTTPAMLSRFGAPRAPAPRSPEDPGPA